MRFHLSVILETAVVFALLTGPVLFASDRSCGDRSRDAFLRRMDSALLARDATAILQLSDVEDWRNRYRTEPPVEAMVLPRAPLTRVRDLSQSEVLYLDGGGRQWRLRLECRAGRYVALLFDAPCPRGGGGAALAPEWERPSRPRSSAPSVWTPVECWPLPR